MQMTVSAYKMLPLFDPDDICNTPVCEVVLLVDVLNPQLNILIRTLDLLGTIRKYVKRRTKLNVTDQRK